MGHKQRRRAKCLLQRRKLREDGGNLSQKTPVESTQASPELPSPPQDEGNVTEASDLEAAVPPPEEPKASADRGGKVEEPVPSKLRCISCGRTRAKSDFAMISSDRFNARCRRCVGE